MNAELQTAERQDVQRPAAQSPQATDSPRPETTKPRTGGGVYTPRVNVLETADALVVSADLPGVKPEDVSLDWKGGELLLHARCGPRHVGKKLLYTEYGVGDFYRAFRIADQIEPGGIEASLADGVLTVRVPKAEAVRPKRIAVRGA
jgi:HSP20 family protein